MTFAGVRHLPRLAYLHMLCPCRRSAQRELQIPTCLFHHHFCTKPISLPPTPREALFLDIIPRTVLSQNGQVQRRHPAPRQARLYGLLYCATKDCTSSPTLGISYQHLAPDTFAGLAPKLSPLLTICLTPVNRNSSATVAPTAKTTCT